MVSLTRKRWNMLKRRSLQRKTHKHCVNQMKFCMCRNRRMSPKTTNIAFTRNQTRDCYCCGRKKHKADSRKQLIQGHLARVCRAKPTHKLEKGEIEEKQFVGIYHLDRSDTKPYMVSLSLNGAPLKMDVDTGATRTIVSEKTYRMLWKKRPELSPTKVRLRTYSGQQLVVLGTLRVNVKY